MIKYLTHVPYFADVPFAEVSGEAVCFVEHPLHVFKGRGVPVGYVAVELYRACSIVDWYYIIGQKMTLVGCCRQYYNIHTSTHLAMYVQNIFQHAA